MPPRSKVLIHARTMKTSKLQVNICFLENAKERFNFPIKNPVRISFWLLNDVQSTPCELLINGFEVDVQKKYTIEITVIEQAFLAKKLLPNRAFKIGLFPIEIASGKIIKEI
jgi:hypothetical protein